MPSEIVIRDIISNVDPRIVPHRFISCIKLTDDQGNVDILKGADVTEFLDNSEDYYYVEVRVCMDAALMRRVLIEETAKLFEDAYKGIDH